MAGSITIAGTDLYCTDGGEGDPILIGEESRSFSGTLRNSVRGQKRTFSGVSSPTAEATWDTLRAAVDNGEQVTVSGEILSGDSITASVKVNAKAAPGLPDFFVISFAGQQV